MIEIDCEWMIKFSFFDTISFFHCQNIHVIYTETNEIKKKKVATFNLFSFVFWFHFQFHNQPSHFQDIHKITDN